MWMSGFVNCIFSYDICTDTNESVYTVLYVNYLHDSYHHLGIAGNYNHLVH